MTGADVIGLILGLVLLVVSLHFFEKAKLRVRWYDWPLVAVTASIGFNFINHALGI